MLDNQTANHNFSMDTPHSKDVIVYSELTNKKSSGELPDQLTVVGRFNAQIMSAERSRVNSFGAKEKTDPPQNLFQPMS